VARVAVVTDSAADLPPEVAVAAGITVVPLIVSFGSQSFKAGTELTTDAFWERMLAPDAPFPTTAAASPGDFQQAYQRCFDDGADAIVSVHVGSDLSGTIKSATIAAEMFPEREIHVVDSRSASMGVGLLALLATRLASEGQAAAEVARVIQARVADVDLYVALDTLEYLKKGGRISAAQAAIGGILAVKPIITVREGKVDTADRVRTRGKARERVLELLSQVPVEGLAILYTPGADAETFRDDLVARIPGGVAAAAVSIEIVGASVGPHLGPGCLGAVILTRR
jgi:DegV family protein with EDD domain